MFCKRENQIVIQLGLDQLPQGRMPAPGQDGAFCRQSLLSLQADSYNRYTCLQAEMQHPGTGFYPLCKIRRLIVACPVLISQCGA